MLRLINTINFSEVSIYSLHQARYCNAYDAQDIMLQIYTTDLKHLRKMTILLQLWSRSNLFVCVSKSPRPWIQSKLLLLLQSSIGRIKLYPWHLSYLDPIQFPSWGATSSSFLLHMKTLTLPNTKHGTHLQAALTPQHGAHERIFKLCPITHPHGAHFTLRYCPSFLQHGAHSLRYCPSSTWGALSALLPIFSFIYFNVCHGPFVHEYRVSSSCSCNHRWGVLNCNRNTVHDWIQSSHTLNSSYATSCAT